MRGVLLGGPALLAFAASLVLSAVLFMRELAMPFGVSAIALAPIAFLAGALGIAIFFAIAWVPWALVVFVVVAVLRPARWMKRRLRVMALAPARAPSSLRERGRQVMHRVVAAVAARRWTVLAGLVALWFCLQLVALFLESPDWLATRSVTEALKTLGGVAIGELVGLGMLAVPAAAAGHALAWSYAATSDGWVALKRASLRSPRPAPVEPSWREGRNTVQGTVMVRRPVVAPVSGEPCAAFRLFGSAEGVVIDDGDAGDLAVQGAGGVVDLRAGVVAVALDVSGPRDAIDGAARERVVAFLAERGVTLTGTVRVRESVLHDGEAARVTGAPAKDRDPEGGYRGADRDVLGDGDGLPLLLERAGAS